MRYRSGFGHLARPFEILRLIRDGIVNDRWELLIHDSRFNYYIIWFIDGLVELGLIEVGEKSELRATEYMKRLLATLDLSLKQLSPFNLGSVVSSPEFGLPSDPPERTDMFVLMPFNDTLKPVEDAGSPEYGTPFVHRRDPGFSVQRNTLPGAGSFSVALRQAALASAHITTRFSGRSPSAPSPSYTIRRNV